MNLWRGYVASYREIYLWEPVILIRVRNGGKKKDQKYSKLKLKFISP
jgi:hypothetical protein